MGAGMSTSLVLLAVYWCITLLIVGPTAVALYHRTLYRREANELLQSNLPPAFPAKPEHTERLSVQLLRPPSISWVPYRFSEYLPKKLVRLLLYFTSAFLVTFVLPRYVFPPLGLQPGGQHLTSKNLIGLFIVLSSPYSLRDPLRLGLRD